jgi:nucleoside-diphosphate kinase
MEKTFVMLKPDAVSRGLMGEIISRLEKKGLIMVAAKFMVITEDIASRHYAEHVKKPFYPDLLSFITSGPVLAMVWEGEKAVSVVRNVVGKTDPVEALPGTIRGDYGMIKTMNLIHASDSLESAEREISIFFRPEELINWERADQKWLSF